MIRLLALVLVASAASLHAEEWVDFNSRVVGMGSSGAVLARGPSGARYNPANAAARPWEKGELFPLTLEFDIPTGMAAALHGDDFNVMFEVVEAANDLQDRFDDGAFNTPSSADLDDYHDLFSIFNNLDALDSLSGDGIYSNFYTGIATRMGNLFLDGDGLSITLGGFSIASAAVVVDFDSLRNYRFTEESGAVWDAFVSTAAVLSGEPGKAPTTSGGQQFSSDLQAAGYGANEADILAATAEDAGVNFGGVGASILFDFLVNTRNGTGTSLESGADPLEGNQSGFVVRGLAFYEIGISYGFPLPIPVVGEWLSVGATLRLIQAYTFSDLLTVSEMNKNGIEDTLEKLGKQVQSAYTLDSDASRFNVGVDLGVVFTPQIPYLDTLAVSAVGRNLNGPEFRWKPVWGTEPRLIRFDPQFALGVSYMLFHDAGLPLTFAVEADLNRVSSDILPRYHSQMIRAGIGFEPQWGGIGFGLRLGMLKNLADAEQAFTLTFGTGLRLWLFHIDFAGQLGLKNTKFGTDEDNRVVPQRFGFSVQLGLNFEF